ncbi:hypothetical protein RND81_02G088700 [Saponaria officinalis]|uniref:C3H1-type domain-containing protein n=1 Tax=Saponaria officinalis TaxID=3572 RepID=A0AAW1MLM5_SAPOF
MDHHHRINHLQRHHYDTHHRLHHHDHPPLHLRHPPFPLPPPPPSRVSPLSPFLPTSSNHQHRRPEVSFVDSPLHHHHHHRPHHVYDDRSPVHHLTQFREGFDDFSSAVDRRRFDFVESRVPPLSPVFHRQVDFHDCLSPPLPPPPFIDYFDRFSRDVRSPRFTDEFDVDNRFRLDENRRNYGVVDRDELHGVRFYDERSSVVVVERDELRHNVMYDDWRSMDDFEREELLRRRIDERRRITDDLEREEFLRHRDMVVRDELLCDRIGDEWRIMNDGVLHDSYRSEVSRRGSENILGGNDFIDIRPIWDEKVPMNLVSRSGLDARSDVMHPPFEFRGREIEGEKKFSELDEEQVNYRLRVEQGRRESVKTREELKECYDHSPKNYSSRKKSAFLRLQPAMQDTKPFRTTSSPRKGKGTDIESLGHRSNEAGVESPIDLDVSFKANALLTKAVIGAPSNSKADTKIVSESPLKARRARNRGTNSPVTKKDEKQSGDQVRVSPILMKVGIRKVAEVPDNNSKSSSSERSGLSAGDTTCSVASLEGEVLSKADKRAGFCKASLPGDKRKRKAVNLISCFSAAVPTNLDTRVDVDKSVSSPSGVSMSDAPGSLKPGCVQDQPHMSILDDAITKSVEKCSSDIDFEKAGGQNEGPTLTVSVGDNVRNFDVCDGRMDSLDALATSDSITCDINVHKPCGLSSKYDIIGEQCRDGDDDNESVRHSVDEMKLLCSRSVDVSDGDIVRTDCMKIITISDIEVTNGIQEQGSTCAGSILVNEARKRRKLSQKACVLIGGNLGHLAPPSVKDDIFLLDRKRKVGVDVCDIDSKENPCNCCKERKSKTVHSVFIDTSVSESCDLCSSANALKSLPSEHLYSIDYSEQPAGVHKSSNSLLLPEDVVGEATTSLLTVANALGNCPKAEVEHKGSHSSVEEIVQSSYVAESKYNKKDDDNLIGASKSNGNELIRPDSVDELAKNCRNSGGHWIRPNHAVGLNDEPLVTDMECESNITVERNLAMLSDCPFSCAAPTQEMASSNLVMMTKPSKLNSIPVFSQVTNSDDKVGGDDKKSESLKSVKALISQSNIVCGRFQKNAKPGNSAAPSNLPVTRKAASIPSKYANKGASVSSSISRQFSWRNEVTLGKTTISSGQASPVATFSKKKLVSIPAKPRTWHRTLAASSTIVKKPSSSPAPPQRLPNGKSLGVQDTSYVRKGNSLVRNSASSTTALGPHANNSSILEKSIDINKNGTVKGSGVNKSTVLSGCLITGGRLAPVDIPRKPPLSCTEKTSDCKIAHIGECRSPPQVERFEKMDDSVALKTTESGLSLFGNPEIVLDRSFEVAANLSDGVVQASNVKKVVYIKRKANQLIAASTSPELSGRIVDNKSGLSSDNSYYKRRKHQLIRASSESNIQKMVSAVDDSSNSRMQRAFNAYSRRSASKRQSSRVKSSKVSLVWKLGDAKSSDKGSAPLRSKQLLSHLLPWKRTTYRRSVWRASASTSDCSSLIKTRKLFTSRNQAVVYVRSGRGFSLKRSKVISLAGSLKWSKSMEKRSKKIDAEATLAVAVSDSTAKQKAGASCVSSETGIKKLPPHKSVHGLKLRRGERIFRIGLFRYRMDPSRRTLQRISDEEAPDSTPSKTENYANKSYMPKRLLIGSDEYVRIGNGNQLVRDPKRRTRILASEKVRWSLHTARLRLAKKRRFCQFFTRFGRCNKGEGKCPYIHDSSKITVCTKFLKGLCVDPNCKLTHKVIPDRMPDCSFYLQGSCSNESCPYRHVNVDPKASICESFSRGYCSEGNECRKKHSYLCPEFEATGSCPQGSKCKLYHPKKGMSKKGKISEDQRNIRGRYFDPGLAVTVAEPENESAILEKDVSPMNYGVISKGEDFGDYISLDVSDDEEGESVCPSNDVNCLSEFVAPMNSDALSGADFADFINLDDEATENKCLNKEVMYLSEFDALTYLSDDVDE